MHARLRSRLMPRPLVVAHRGAIDEAPENTLAAFERAIELGADTIEFDVQPTRDGQLVVYHDYYLGRTTPGRGRVDRHSLDDLRSLDAGSWFHPRFASERIPTMREVLELGAGRVRFEIELKGTTTEFLTLALDEITLMQVRDAVEITSGHVPLLTHVRRAMPDVRIGAFFSSFPRWMEDDLGYEHVAGWLRLLGANVAHLDSLSPEGVALLHGQGFLVHGANLPTESEMRRGVEAGIDQFSTDTLSVALRVVKPG